MSIAAVHPVKMTSAVQGIKKRIIAPTPDVKPKVHEVKSKVAEEKTVSAVPVHGKKRLSVWNSTTKTVFLALVALSLFARLYRLSKPAQVVFDEVHFGGFASQYLRREYYYDVHPPLGKMLIAGMGYFFGFDGSFRFEKIGLDYNKGNAPYVMMRLGMVAFGTGAIGLALASLLEMGVSVWGVGLAGILMGFDNALVTQTKFILLDSMLFFFIMASVWSWTKFRQLRREPFSTEWWKYLSLTGASIAGSLGVKMVGLFTVATIGLATLHDLWQLSDQKRHLPNKQLWKHFWARALCLGALPLALYLSFFWVHLRILIKTGPGDVFMSSDFQAGLEGNALHSTSRQVFFGQTVRVKSKVDEVYLYSHTHLYPLHHEDGKVSSQGQQVTGYGGEDANSEWVIMPQPDQPLKSGEKRPLRNGATVRLLHKATKKYLLTHDVASPLTMTNQEVTAVEDGQKLEETLFTFEVKQGNAEKVMSKSNVFRLIHKKTEVAINNHQEMLPKWMPGHREINGDKRGNRDGCKWVISDVIDPADEAERKEMAARKKPALSFFRKFVELQGSMLRSNGMLHDEHPFKSHPATWPFVQRGMAFWDKTKEARIYLLGNIVAWYISLAGLVVLGACLIKENFLKHRFGEAKHLGSLQGNLSVGRLNTVGGFLLGAWALHYLPFYTMHRSLYLHHYLPSYMFSAMGTAVLLDHLMQKWTGVRRALVYPAVLLMGVAVVGTFMYFAPITYGTAVSTDALNASRKWVSTWDWP